MPDPIEALILDLLEWIGPDSRPYAEVMDAWRTSCPRLQVWEDANERGFIARDHEEGLGTLVSVTPAGREHLLRNRPRRPIDPVAVVAAEAPPRTKASNYPEPFASRMAGRRKQPLGDVFGLVNFGVNLTRLAPRAVSSLRHAHTKQDEFIYVLQGYPTLHTDEGRTRLSPGMCAGFKAGTGNGHRLINETDEEVVYLEVGDRTPGDEGSYPDDDLEAALVDGKWTFVHKDGSPY